MMPVMNFATVKQLETLHDELYDSQVFSWEYLGLCHFTNDELNARHYQYPVPRYLSVAELQRIMDWKYPPGRTRHFASKNGPEKVREITGAAFNMANANVVEAVNKLCELHGVGVRMASAILTVFNPLEYTMLDVRAWGALKKMRLLDPMGLTECDERLDDPHTYEKYLLACRQLAAMSNVSLRSLDRCLWTVDEKNLYGWIQSSVTLAPLVTP